ncbi:MAG: nitroreductase family protein [Acidimicrobiales bacterium]|nr:nitroreductase family protein [Acidimicrobiales bacterium]
MDLVETLRTTGAVRVFTDDPVPDEVVWRILDTARFAPSGGNRQPWRVVVVKDPTTKAAIGDLNRRALREYFALESSGQRAFALSQQGRWPGPRKVDLDAARHRETPLPVADEFARSPVMLVVLVDLGEVAAVDVELDRHGLAAGASIYPFCHQIVLAARAEGLGGVATTVAMRYEPELLALVGAAPGWAVASVVTLGRPVRAPRRLSRRAVVGFTTVDRVDGLPLGSLDDRPPEG